MSDHGHFSSYEGHKERRMGNIRGAFSRMHRALDGWMLKASTTMDLGISIFRIFVRCGLEKLGLVDQNWLVERNLSALLLRTLFVGRRKTSESIEAALDME